MDFPEIDKKFVRTDAHKRASKKYVETHGLVKLCNAQGTIIERDEFNNLCKNSGLTQRHFILKAIAGELGCGEDQGKSIVPLYFNVRLQRACEFYNEDINLVIDRLCCQAEAAMKSIEGSGVGNDLDQEESW